MVKCIRAVEFDEAGENMVNQEDNSNKKFWNRFASKYDLIIKKDEQAYEEMIRLIRRDVNSKMEMLELATGTGLIALRIADKVKYLEATDFSEEMIKEAKRKERPNNLNFSVEDACDLPYGSKTFDCVLISNALHIIPKPEEALSNIKRVLKDDGILIAPTFAHKSSIKSKVLTKLMSIIGFKAYSKWTTDEYIKFIKSNGFKIKKSKKIKGTFELAYVVAIKESR